MLIGCRLALAPMVCPCARFASSGSCPDDLFRQSKIVVPNLAPGTYVVVQSGYSEHSGAYNLTMDCSAPVPFETAYQGRLGCDNVGDNALSGNTEDGAVMFGRYNSRECGKFDIVLVPFPSGSDTLCHPTRATGQVLV